MAVVVIGILNQLKKASSISNRLTWSQPETLARYTESMQKVWTDPVRNAKISAANKGENNHMFGKSPSNKLLLSNDERLVHNRALYKAAYLRRKARKLLTS